MGWSPSTAHVVRFFVGGILRLVFQVSLTRASSVGTGSVPEQGLLSMASDLKFVAKKPKTRFSTTYLASIRDVELHQSGTDQAYTCRILVRSPSTARGATAGNALALAGVLLSVSVSIRVAYASKYMTFEG